MPSFGTFLSNFLRETQPKKQVPAKKMQIDIITLFPEMFRGPFDESIVARAIDNNKLTLNIHNLRDWAIDERGTVDDRPYGGGTGMLLRPEPIFSATDHLRSGAIHRTKTKTILLDAGGKLYNQQKAVQLSKMDGLILICGHYEGVDYRVHERLADEVLSIGDYVLTGGEIPAMVLVDSITRLLPGVLEKPEATQSESFSPTLTPKGPKDPKVPNLLEFPQYTRPENFRDHAVPEVLLSGNHAEIQKWREEKALERTQQNRPDLLSL